MSVLLVCDNPIAIANGDNTELQQLIESTKRHKFRNYGVGLKQSS